MPLRSPDLAPGGIEALRTPFERRRQGGIEAVEVREQIRLPRRLEGESSE